jgi:hypothetical protein
MGNGSRHCEDATMLRDNLVGLFAPMLSSAAGDCSRCWGI